MEQGKPVLSPIVKFQAWNMAEPKQRNVVGPQVRRRRYERGWTQEQCALRLQLAGLDWSRVALAKVEIGIREVSDAELFVLARALTVPLERLYPPEAEVKTFLARKDKG